MTTLYRSPEVKHRLERSLSGIDDIRSVQANIRTGNLLVTFNPHTPLGDIVQSISDRLKPRQSNSAGHKVNDGLPPCVQANRRPTAEEQAACLTTDALHFTALPAVILGSSPLVRLPISFVRTFSVGLFHTSPILILLTSLIVLMGQIIGKKEGWSRLDALYFSFVTASTIGYGDLRPTQKSTKLLSIAIGLVGLLLTGVLTAIGVNSAHKAFQNIP